MRDYSRIDEYLNKLAKDIYPQPQDPKHTLWALLSIFEFMLKAKDVHSVIDLGCGEGFCEKFFKLYGVEYVGVCLGKDYEIATENSRNVIECDFSFLPFTDNNYDFLYSRHSLEHSPLPLLTLMEWRRVTRKYVAIVVPSVEFTGYGEKNHYYVLYPEQWKVLFIAAGFSIIYEKIERYQDGNSPDTEIEYWFLLEKNVAK